MCAASDPSSPSYGSGQYGVWRQGPHAGLPEFLVTNNTFLSGEFFPTGIAQIGNDRTVALFTNGEVSLRADEGGPKLLNRFSAADGQFRGGLVHVLDSSSEVVAHTHTEQPQPGLAQSLALGVGYVQANATNTSAQVAVSSTIFTPFGSLPVLVQAVTLRNTAPAASAGAAAVAANLSVLVNYGGQFVELLETDASGTASYGYRCSHSFTRVAPSGSGDAAVQANGLLHFAHPPANETPSQPLPPAGPARWKTNGLLHDPSPRPTFLLHLADGSAPAARLVAVGTSGRRLFPSGSALAPRLPLDNSLDTSGPEAVLALHVALAQPLPAGESRTLYFVYGYLANRTSVAHNDTAAAQQALQALLANTPQLSSAEALAGWLAASSQQWRAEAPLEFRVPGKPWIEREVLWHGAMLRHMLSFDDFFEESILNQAGQYLYKTGGFQGAARDPLAHVAPLTYGSASARAAVKSVLRYTLKETRFCPTGGVCRGTSDGYVCVHSSTGEAMRPNTNAASRENGYPNIPCSIPWAKYAFGVDYSDMFPSDLHLWFILTTSEYVLATRDRAFLAETVALETGADVTVADALAVIYEQFLEVVGFGEHKLVRLLNCDHNDGLLNDLHIPTAQAGYVHEHGESVMNSAMAVFIFERFAELIRFSGSSRLVALQSNVTAVREQLTAAVQATWVPEKGWYKRVFLGDQPGLGWRGDADDGVVWLEPNSWAILAGISAAQNTTAALRSSIDRNLRQPSPVGSLFTSNGYQGHPAAYQGIWYCGNWPLTWSLGSPAQTAEVQSDVAFAEWQKNSMAMRSETYGQFFSGTTAGPDCYQSVRFGTPGLALVDAQYPNGVMFNGWAHTYPMITLPYLIGTVFTSDGLLLRPQMSIPAYAIASQLLSLNKTTESEEVATYSGRWAPAVAGSSAETLNVTIVLAPEESAAIVSLSVNGKDQHPIRRTPDGGVTFLAEQLDGAVTFQLVAKR